MKTKLLLLLTLFLCLSGRASAQAFCYTPQFNFYVSRTISATTGTGVPTATTPINLTQTVTLSGHTVIGSQCSMPYPTVQHWATTSNVESCNRPHWFVWNFERPHFVESALLAWNSIEFRSRVLASSPLAI